MLSAKKIQIVTNGDMSANIVSAILPLEQIFGLAIQAIFTTTGTLGGTFVLEGSVNHLEDINGNVIVQGTFSPIANTSYVIAAAGNKLWNVDSAMYPYLRLSYTKAMSDSGTLNVFASLKGV